MLGIQLQADLLPGFAHCTGEAIDVARIFSPSRERHMPGPGVALAFGALDHQDMQLAIAHLQNQGDRGALHQWPQYLPSRAMTGEFGLD